MATLYPSFLRTIDGTEISEMKVYEFPESSDYQPQESTPRNEGPSEHYLRYLFGMGGRPRDALIDGECPDPLCEWSWRTEIKDFASVRDSVRGGSLAYRAVSEFKSHYEQLLREMMDHEEDEKRYKELKGMHNDSLDSKLSVKRMSDILPWAEEADKDLSLREKLERTMFANGIVPVIKNHLRKFSPEYSFLHAEILMIVVAKKYFLYASADKFNYVLKPYCISGGELKFSLQEEIRELFTKAMGGSTKRRSSSKKKRGKLDDRTHGEPRRTLFLV